MPPLPSCGAEVDPDGGDAVAIAAVALGPAGPGGLDSPAAGTSRLLSKKSRSDILSACISDVQNFSVWASESVVSTGELRDQVPSRSDSTRAAASGLASASEVESSFASAPTLTAESGGSGMTSSSTSTRLRFEVGTRVRDGLGGVGSDTGARVKARVAARADSRCVGAGIGLEMAEKFASESSWDGPVAFAGVDTGA